MGFGPPRAGERLARLPDVPPHGRGPGRGRRRRVADLREHQRRGRSRDVRGGLAARDHVQRAVPALPDGRGDHERAAGAAEPVAGADGADGRGRGEDRARRPVQAARARRDLRPDLVAGRRRRQGPRALAAVHERAGTGPGDLHPPRRVRHRLPGPRPQHPRPQLPRAGGGTRRGHPTAHAGPLDRARGRRLPRAPRRPRRRRPPPIDGDGAGRRAGGGIARLDGAAPALAGRDEDAAETPEDPGQGVERQRRLPHHRLAPDPRRAADRRPDDHQRDRLPRRLVGWSPVPDRGRWLPGPASRLRPRQGPFVQPVAPPAAPAGRAPGRLRRRLGDRSPDALVLAGPRRGRWTPAPAQALVAVRRARARPRLGPQGQPTDDRGDHRDASRARDRDGRRAARAADVDGREVPDHAAPARRLRDGLGPQGQRRRSPRRGLGPSEPVRRRRLDRPRGDRRQPVRTIAALAERIASQIIAEGR